MKIMNNLPALTAFTSLSSANKSLQETIGVLSTGLRINSSSDDAAGFALSEKMRSQIGGLDAALRNSQDGISLLQTAEGALSQTNDMLQRIGDLSIQASNDSLTSNDRHYIQLEIDELKKQIDQIANTTQFNKKRILDGSSGALWASSDPGVSVRINGGLTRTDNFGQKVSAEGNYRIEVTASPGEAQVQKSNIFTQTIRLDEVNGISSTLDLNLFQAININAGTDPAGSVSGEGWNFADNTLTITGDGLYRIEGNGEATANHITVNPGVNASVVLDNVNIDVSNDTSGNIKKSCAFYMQGAEVYMYLKGRNSLTSGGHRAGIEVTAGAALTITSIKGDYSVNDADSLIARGGFHGAGIGGGCLSGGGLTEVGDIIIKGGSIEAVAGYLESSGGRGAGIGGGINAVRGNIIIEGGKIIASGKDGGAGIGGGYSHGSGHIEINIDNPNLFIETSGYIESGQSESIGCGQGGSPRDVNYVSLGFTPDDNLLAAKNCKLSDFPTFFSSDGISLLAQPQTINITQGDGQTASITLYATDTMQDAAEKINHVIANTFGHAKNTDNLAKFCTISDGTEGTSESVYSREPIYDSEGNITGYNVSATMLIRSAIPGKDGELYFSGDEELLNALGLNTINEASESKLTASVYDAHTGERINTMKAEGSEFKSIIPPEIDIDIDPMTTAISSSWDESTKRFIFAHNHDYMAMLHLKDNGITFQTGANGGENFSIQLGDMSAKSLSLSRINVATRESASRSIGLIDRAITRVSSQRAKIGAYINGLEHTVSNLTTTSANITSSESRLRDADMALTMMDFVRLQILNQSGTSMLAQANQLPQSVMSLMQ